MSWWMLAGAGLSALSGAAQSNSAAAAQARQQVEAMRQQLESNEAGLEANLKNLTRTNAKAALVRMQAGLSARSTAGAISDIGVQELSAKGEASAAAGAAGAVGASVQAVASDITRQASQAALYTQQDEDINQMNFEQRVQDLYINLDNSLHTPRVNSMQRFQSEGLGSTLLNTAVNFAGMYAMSKMSLGLGSAQTPFGVSSAYTQGGSFIQNAVAGNGTLGAFLNR